MPRRYNDLTSATRMAEAEAFVAALRRAGREVWEYQGRLRVTGWWKPEEQEFVRTHRAELRAIAAQRSTGRRAADVLAKARSVEEQSSPERTSATSPADIGPQDSETDSAAQTTDGNSIPDIERTPDIRINGERITEADVKDTLLQLGDEVFADYRAGRMSKAEAYDITRRRIEQLLGISNRQQRRTYYHDITVTKRDTDRPASPVRRTRTRKESR